MPFLPRVYSLLVMCFIACFSIIFGNPSLSTSSSFPTADTLQKLVTDAHDKFKDVTAGKNADYIPYLAKVDPSRFGIAIVTADGQKYTAGDTDYPFAIESISKPFTLALVMQDHGEEAVVERIGVEPTGMPFNSVAAVKRNQSAENPLVNAGAMAAVSLVNAISKEERWERIRRAYDKFAGTQLQFNQEVYESERMTNQRNRNIAKLLFGYGLLYADPLDTVDVYTEQCSINVTATQLAMMGATLANGGVHPVTGERAVDAKFVPKILAVMMMAGSYDGAGLWAWNTGLPAKTGVGGGIVAVVPGKLAIAAFSPPLDKHGASVRAAKAIEHISKELGLNLFDASR
jgi:glutaminase